MLVLLAATSAMAYLSRNAIGVAESTMRQDLGLSLEQSGWFMGAFFWTYAVLQLPSGWFSERVGTRLLLSASAVGWSLATLGIGLAPAFWLLVLAQFIMGAAQAGVLPASCSSIGHWMPVAQRTLSCGVLSSGMQAGAIVASALTALLTVHFGWRWAFVAIAPLGILWSLYFYSRFRDQPSQSTFVNPSELAIILSDRDPIALNKIPARSLHAEASAMVRSPVVWWLCGQQICRAAGYMFFVSWLPTFLQITSGMSIEHSGYLQGIVLFAMAPGNILGGALTDLIWRHTGSLRLSRSGVATAALTLCSFSLLGAWFVQDVTVTVTFLALGGFFIALAGPSAFAAAIDVGGHRVPQIVAVMNMVGNFAAALCPVIVAAAFRITNDWSDVLLLFSALLLCGSFSWLFVNPNIQLQ